jgi:hypothetical protein
LNLLEGYFSIHNFSNRENITFVLLKAVPHVKDRWETFCEQKETEEPSLFTIMTTWESFRDAIKEQYYPTRSYDDLYTKWTTLRQERDQAVKDFTNIFHTLRTKLGIKDSERHMVLKYRGALHRYIQIKMEFLDISSLGMTYRYAVKIEKNTWAEHLKDLGRTLATYSAGSAHPAIAHAICQLGKILLRDGQGPLPRLHN